MIAAITLQLRTTDLSETIRFYTEKLGVTVDFVYGDVYAGLRIAHHAIHLKCVDVADPSY